jgi:hypothetical protein
MSGTTIVASDGVHFPFCVNCSNELSLKPVREIGDEGGTAFLSGWAVFLQSPSNTLVSDDRSCHRVIRRALGGRGFDRRESLRSEYDVGQDVSGGSSCKGKHTNCRYRQ